MKIISHYICDKCGKAYEHYEDACKCEESHCEIDWHYTTMMDAEMKYRPGEEIPTQVVLAMTKDPIWNTDAGSKLCVYKLEGMLDEETASKYRAKYKKYVDERNALLSGIDEKKGAA